MSYEPSFIWGMFSKEHERPLSPSAQLAWAQWPHQAATWHVPALGDWGNGHRSCLGARLSQAGLFLQGMVFHGGYKFGADVPRLCGTLQFNNPSNLLSGVQWQWGWVAASLQSLLPVDVLQSSGTKMKQRRRVFCLGMELWCIKEDLKDRKGGRAEMSGGEMSPLELQFSSMKGSTSRSKCQTKWWPMRLCASASLEDRSELTVVRNREVVVS